MRSRPNWVFIAGVASCFVVPWLVSLTSLNPRLVGALLGFAAFVLLAFRFADCYRQTQTAGRIAVVLVLSSLLIGAVGQIDLLGDAPLTAVVYPLIGQRWACLLYGICYRRIMGLGTDSPWVRPRGAAHKRRLPA